MNELEKDVLTMIGENIDSPDVFSDITPIRDSLNDAIEEISMLTGIQKEVYSIPLFQEQAFYRLKFSRGNAGFVVSAWLRNNKIQLDQTDLIKLSFENPRWLRSSGPPREYLQVGMDIIGVVPPPAGTGDILDLEFAVIPERYTDDNARIKLRDSFKKSVVHLGISEYYASRGDAKEAFVHLAKYVESLPIEYQEAAEKNYFFRGQNESR